MTMISILFSFLHNL